MNLHQEQIAYALISFRIAYLAKTNRQAEKTLIIWYWVTISLNKKYTHTICSLSAIKLIAPLLGHPKFQVGYLSVIPGNLQMHIFRLCPRHTGETQIE